LTHFIRHATLHQSYKYKVKNPIAVIGDRLV